MITIFTYIAISIFILYTIISLCIFKTIPYSLSNTYYMYKEKKEWLKYLFPIVMFLTSGFLLPAWLEATEGSVWQFLSFLTCASIMFVGAAPNFKDTNIESKIHEIAAICAAVFSILWSIIVVGSWEFIIMWLLYFIAIALLTDTLKKSYIFWLEMAAFISLFSNLIIFIIVI